MLSDTALFQGIVLATLAGSTIPIGAYLAKIEHIRPKWLEEEFRHSLIAFGGGILIAAVSFILVPEGLKTVPLWGSILAFILGGLSFYAIDKLLERFAKGYSQLIAMVTDFVPEALALGAMLAVGNHASLLLVAMIAFQNLPESFNAYREILHTKRHRSKKVILWFTGLAFLGPIAALIGDVFLSHSPIALGSIMLFAAGGILYLVFQDIAPKAYLKNRHAPTLGAVLGYLLGLIGHALVS